MFTIVNIARVAKSTNTTVSYTNDELKSADNIRVRKMCFFIERNDIHLIHYMNSLFFTHLHGAIYDATLLFTVHV